MARYLLSFAKTATERAVNASNERVVAGADQTPVRPWSDQPAINDCRQAEVMN